MSTYYGGGNMVNSNKQQKQQQEQQQHQHSWYYRSLVHLIRFDCDFSLHFDKQPIKHYYFEGLLFEFM